MGKVSRITMYSIFEVKNKYDDEFIIIAKGSDMKEVSVFDKERFLSELKSRFNLHHIEYNKQFSVSDDIERVPIMVIDYVDVDLGVKDSFDEAIRKKGYDLNKTSML